MGKAKKGRKGCKEDNSESDGEIDTHQIIETTNNKKNKSGKIKDVNERIEDNIVKVQKGAKKNGKSNKKVDTDGSADEDPVSKVSKPFIQLRNAHVDDDSENKEMITGISENHKKDKSSSKKGKRGRKNRDDSDDDLDTILAELALEYSGVKVEHDPNEGKEEQTEESKKSTSTKVKKQTSVEGDVKITDKNTDKIVDAENDQELRTVKTAAQKKKEKKEREKQKKIATKAVFSQKTDDTEISLNIGIKSYDVVEECVEAAEDGKKKKKKSKSEEKDLKEMKKGPGKKTIAAMQEALKKIKEEEERRQKEEEERIRREEDAEAQRLEQLRLEQERKDKRKKKEKERKERLKAEGKLLTAKQKADRARAQAMLESLKAQGHQVPTIGEKKSRLGTRVRTNKKQQVNMSKEDVQITTEEIPIETKPIEMEVVENVLEKNEPFSDDDVKDCWDEDSTGEEESEETSAVSESKGKIESMKSKVVNTAGEDEEEESSSAEDEDGSYESSDDGAESNHMTDAERRKTKAKARIEERRIEAEKNKSIDNLRAAIVCVLGHVDTGKTKILDKLRRTNVQDGEAGGITQQIGATNVPIDAIKENIKFVKGISTMTLKVPGLLIIDTPGHESFSNLRSRGSSLCDIAILVVDIMHGLEPQTIESINLLKLRKTPFIVALNKIDRLYDWQTMNRKDVSDTIKAQAINTQREFEDRAKNIILQFAEQGLNAALFYDNPDVRSYISLVPTSAVSGDGMGNLLALLVEYSQNMLGKRLMYCDELQATVLEVKAIPGLGTTIDVILVNGTLREGDTMLLAGTEGPIVTQIRSLLMPQPMRELRVKNAYIEYKEIKAAQGVKIAAKELEKAIAGLNLYVARKLDEVEVLKDDVTRELKSALSGIKLQERGVYVQASTLGSLEALLEFLRTSKIPYSGIRIGPVVKRDIMKASIMLEHEELYATILAFDVKIERDAQELADSLGVKIFQADIIYHLFDKFTAYKEELKQRKREEFKNIAVFPCKLRVLPQFIFNSRDPIVIGVMVEAGIVKRGTPICVPSKDFVELGVVTSIENNHNPIETARKGLEVCIKIEPIPGESPKMFGRHFDEKDTLISRISRQSIDACKNHFRDDLLSSDWKLMVELKNVFQIL